MNLTQTVIELCSKLHVTMAELSRRTNQSPQNLCRKIKNETISYNEFLRILEVLGVEYEYTLSLPGEEKPEIIQENSRMKERADLLASQLELSERTVQYYRRVLRDVRAGLGIINGHADQALKTVKNTAHTGECLRAIRSSGKRLSELIADTSLPTAAPDEAEAPAEPKA